MALLVMLPALSATSNVLLALRHRERALPSIVSLLGVGFGSVIVLVPSVWYLWRIGVANPIVAAGVARFGMDNLAKSLDLFLDLNQGMVLIQICALVVLGAWVVNALVRLPAANEATRHRFGRVMGLLALTGGMAVLAASAQNWNPGITVVSRYSYWLSVPVLVALCIALEGISNMSLRNQLELIVLFSALVLVGLFGLHGKTANYVAFTPPAKLAMRVLPNWYFPHPEVFCERAQEREDCAFDRAYVYFLADGRPIKVLVSEDYVLNVCGAPAREASSRRESYQGKVLLWFSGGVSCQSTELKEVRLEYPV